MYFQLVDNQVLSTQGQHDVFNLHRLTSFARSFSVAASLLTFAGMHLARSHCDTRCSVGHGELGMIVYLLIMRCTGYYVIFSHRVPQNTPCPTEPTYTSSTFSQADTRTHYVYEQMV